MAAHRRQRPTFEEEQAFAHAGARFVAGVDEVGRGPLAGPVVAAAVILPLDWIAAGKSGEAGSANPREMLNDSKKLSPRWREQLHGIIVKTAIAWGVGCDSPGHEARRGEVVLSPGRPLDRRDGPERPGVPV